MSEHVEVVERLMAGFNRRDDDWQAVLGKLSPDLEINDLDISLVGSWGTAAPTPCS